MFCKEGGALLMTLQNLQEKPNSVRNFIKRTLQQSKDMIFAKIFQQLFAEKFRVCADEHYNNIDISQSLSGLSNAFYFSNGLVFLHTVVLIPHHGYTISKLVFVRNCYQLLEGTH